MRFECECCLSFIYRFVLVFKKFNSRWLAHIVAFHQWVKKEKEGQSLDGTNRSKREIVAKTKLEITGNHEGTFLHTYILVHKYLI